jgi:hypothetical protein
VPTPDATFDRIKRAFDESFKRMCSAPYDTDLEDELSNLLHHLYRLAEWARKQKGLAKVDFFRAALAQSPEARPALWVRTFDTHDALVTASTGDVYSDYYTNMYGVLVWEPLQTLQATDATFGRDNDYAVSLAGKPVLDTIRAAFDQLARI